MEMIRESKLTEVILIIEEMCETELKALEQNLGHYHVALQSVLLSEYDVDEVLKNLSLLNESACKKQGTLYISDNEFIIQQLLENDANVILFLREYNREGSFLGVTYAIESLAGVDYDYLYHVYLRLTGQPWRILTTKRCVVREITLEDVPTLYEIYADPEVVQYTENLYEDIEEELQYTKDYIEKVYGFYGYGMWIIEEKQTGKVIGRAGLEYKEGREGAELGFLIAKPFWRMGIATEVVDAILKYARDELDIFHIYALVEKENEKSIAFCEKMRFDFVEEERQLHKTYLIFEKDI